MRTLCVCCLVIVSAWCSAFSAHALSQSAAVKAAVQGRKMFHKFGCDVCHSTDGSACFGGSMKGLWGTTATLEGGKQLRRDARYFRAKILESAKLPLRDGSNVMPIYKKSINPVQLGQIVAYIRSLGKRGAGASTLPAPRIPARPKTPTPQPKMRAATLPTTKRAGPTSRPQPRKKAKVTDNMPRNDIFLASVTWLAGKMQVGAVTRVTDRKAYDNQPAFLPGNKGLLYTSLREGRQTDVMAYDIASKTHKRLTRTPESEFSPTPMPGGKRFSVVRVERDGTQRLWAFPLSPKSGPATLLFPRLKPVGYHAWGGPDTLVFFILGKPHTLHLGSLRSQRTLPIVGSIGRGMAKIPGKRAFVFVHKLTKHRWWLKSLDMRTKSVAFLRETVPGSEDVTWSPTQVAVMGKGSQLYQWKLGHKGPWLPVATLAKHGIYGITRVVLDSQGKQLAIVGKRAKSQKKQ